MNPVLIEAAFLFLIVGALLLNTLRLQRAPVDVERAPEAAVDMGAASDHLSQALRFKTISSKTAAQMERQPFLDLHLWIEQTYPLIALSLKKTVINDLSLLYTWTGADSALNPVLLNAHMDVVPVDPDSLAEWKYEPFGGAIEEGYIWGRGALDMKCNMVGILEAVMMLLARGYQPQRTVYLAIGHDEEIMGYEGTVKIVEHLKSKGIQLAAVLDEGGMISKGLLEGINDPVALIGITEKGYLTLNLSTRGKPGHSSRPPRQTAVGIISRAIALMDDHPMPACLDYFLPTLNKLGHLMPFGLQVAVANAFLFKWLIIKRLEKKPETNALLRTTHAATMVEGGIKDNILPASASAKINFRLLPGDSIEKVVSYFGRVIQDPRVEMQIDQHAGGWEASQLSSTDTPAYRSLELVVRQVFNNVSTAPYIFLAATDSRYYQPLCRNIFKFSPHILTPQEQSSVHGVNERISQESLSGMVVFYHRLIQVWGDAGF